jgi:hypothetical protein
VTDASQQETSQKCDDNSPTQRIQPSFEDLSQNTQDYAQQRHVDELIPLARKRHLCDNAPRHQQGHPRFISFKRDDEVIL